MERTKKLGTCVAAAFTIFAGATYLSTPAQAAEIEEAMPGCSIVTMAYLQGWVDGTCGGYGGQIHYCSEENDLLIYSCW